MLAVTLLPGRVELARQALQLPALAVAGSGAGTPAGGTGTGGGSPAPVSPHFPAALAPPDVQLRLAQATPPGSPVPPATAGTAADPAEELKDALQKDLDGYWDRFVKNKGKQEHDDKSNLLPRAQVERTDWMAQALLHAAFGSFIPDPAVVSQHGRIVDAFTWADKQLEHWKDDWPTRHDKAVQILRQYSGFEAQTRSELLARHGLPQYRSDGRPANRAAELQDEAIKRLLSSPHGDGIDQVDRVLHVWRGWPGQALQDEGIILVQFFKDPGGDQAVALQLEDLFLTFTHEGAHLLENPRYRQWTRTLPPYSPPFTIAIEGAATGHTEAALTGLGDPRAAELRALVEGIFGADIVTRLLDEYLPRPDSIRYEAHAEYRRLRAAVGGLNFDAAYFLGLVENLTGALGALALGSPKRPLGAAQLAAAVGVLNQASPQQRAALPVTAYLDSTVPDEVIEEALRQPGASHLQVYTAAPALPAPATVPDFLGVRDEGNNGPETIAAPPGPAATPTPQERPAAVPSARRWVPGTPAHNYGRPQ
jgi:hypothetical protein